MEATAQVKGLAGWQKLMFLGFGLWLAVASRDLLGFGQALNLLAVEGMVSILELITGQIGRAHV